MRRAATRTLLRRRRQPSYSSFRCLSNNQQDEAFVWARDNPSLARACLEVPPEADPPLSSVHSFEDYWSIRGWNHTAMKEEYAKRLVSHVLSAPLTLSKHLSFTNICCVGARSESTLPPQYWREMLFTTPNETKICLDFVGPDVQTRPEPLHLAYASSSLRLRWLYRGLLHDYIEQSPTTTWDAFVLFNPGLGHPNLTKHWLPTLKLLLQQKKPLLLTAHSLLDAQRDQRLLEPLVRKAVSYQPNPFCSRITYVDPLNKLHYVQPNKYVAINT